MLTTWNYDESVKRVSNKVQEWKAVSLKKSTLTDDICRELYEARERLRNPRARTDLDCVTNVTQTWERYLADVGLQRMTVHRWLEHYEPSEQRLLTNEEYQRKEQEKRRKQMEHTQAVKNRVAERLRTNAMPNDWDDESEKVYQERLAQEKKDREWRERIRLESRERERKTSKTQETIEEFEHLLSEFTEQTDKRKEISKKMRLTGDNADSAFNQMLIEYLESLDSDSQRLEACYNGIKIFKAYIRDNNLLRG
jgi:hypothetical protein